MRACLLLALGLLVACARGSTGGDTTLELQSTETPPEESTRLPPTMGDASSPKDAASSTEDPPDVAPEIDAAPPKPNACLTAIDVSKGGTFTIDTCATKIDLPATCGAKGSGPGVVLAGEAPMTGSSYQLNVAADWVIQQVDASCKAQPYSCAAAAWGISGYGGTSKWYFVVERADGACGATTVTVNRVQ